MSAPTPAVTLHAVAASAGEAWDRVSALPCELAVEIPVARLRLDALLQLEPGNVLVSSWSSRQEVPIRANQVTVAWGEFEVVGERIAIRIHRVS